MMEELYTETVGAVLAGGRSARFGSPKALALLGGARLFERVLASQREVFSEVVLVTSQPEIYGGFDVPLVADIHPGLGPAAGIHAALGWAVTRGARGVCISPCDAPFLSSSLLRLLAGTASLRDVAAVIPRSAGPLGYEPLFGWYGAEALPVLHSQLVAGSIPMHRLIHALPSVHFVSGEELIRFGVPNCVFHNVNTPSDLRFARELLPRPSADRPAGA